MRTGTIEDITEQWIIRPQEPTETPQMGILQLQKGEANHKRTPDPTNLVKN